HQRCRLAAGERHQCIRLRRTSVCSVRIALLLAPSGLADCQTAGRNRSDFAQPLMNRQSVEAQALPTTLAPRDLLLVPQPLWYKRQDTFQQIKILNRVNTLRTPANPARSGPEGQVRSSGKVANVGNCRPAAEITRSPASPAVRAPRAAMRKLRLPEA